MKTGGASAKRKGDSFERECVNYLLERGVFAERVPLSGAAGGSFGSDIEVMLPYGSRDIKRKIECKIRKRAWKDLYGWLEGNYALFIRADRQKPLVVMPLETFADMHEEKF